MEEDRQLAIKIISTLNNISEGSTSMGGLEEEQDNKITSRAFPVPNLFPGTELALNNYLLSK